VAEQGGRRLSARINFNIAGRQYYVVGEGSGLPAADFLPGQGRSRNTVIVRRDWEQTGKPGE